MKAIITVIGKDKIGILAMIATKANINVLDVSQTIVDGFLLMSVDLKNMETSLSSFSDHMDQLGKEKDLVIRVLRIFLIPCIKSRRTYADKRNTRNDQNDR